MSTETTSAKSTLDPVRVQRVLDGRHAAIRQQAREALARPEFAAAPGMSRAEYREQVLKWTRLIADSGATGLGFPKEYGGGGDVGASIAAFETLAHGDLSLLVKCGVQFGLWGGAVLHLGTRKHHQAYLEDIRTVELPGCFAMTETGHGSDVQSLGTTATYDPATQEFVVNTPDEASRKDYIGNAAQHGRAAAVFAQLIVGGENHGVHAVVVPLRDKEGRPHPGVRIEDCGEKLGLNGVDNGRLWFDNVRVPRDNLLDRYAQVSPDGAYTSSIDNPNKRFFTMLGTLIQGRVSVGGAGISASKNALTIATRYAMQRRQFGPPGGDEVTLMTYPSHMRRLLPAIATTYALHFAQEELVAQLHEAFSNEDTPDRERRKLEATAAGIKAIATWHATSAIQTCREACGGAGYLAENRFAALKADTDVFTTFEGDNTVLMQLVGKSLLTDFKDHLGDLDTLDMARFVTRTFFTTVAEKSAVRELFGRIVDDLVPGRDEERDTLNRDDQLELFRWREGHLLSTVARRLKKGIDDGNDPFEVFLWCQDHMINAARAHVDRLVLETFHNAVQRIDDEDVKALLDRVCDLHALWNMERDRGWFQEHGRISSTRSKALLRAVNRACWDLRDNAGVLVDAFGIPDGLLRAPIATSVAPS